MARYKIVAARCGETEEGFGCEMDMSAVVAEVRLQDEQGEDFYISASFLADVPDFYRTDVSTYEFQTKGNPTKAEAALFGKLLEDGHMGFGEFDEIFEKKDPEWFAVQRYLLYLFDISDDEEEAEEFIEDTIGEYIDEIEIPASSYEEDYTEE